MEDYKMSTKVVTVNAPFPEPTVNQSFPEVRIPQYQSTPTPIHLTATATVPSSTAGVGVNSVALKEPNGFPMEIHTIKFGQLITGTSGIEDGSLILGNVIGCQLSLGQLPLTNGFVPVWGFSRGTYTGRERLASSGLNSYIEYIWRLSRPLYVPAGGIINPVFKHFGGTEAAIDARISYSGLSMPANYKPKKIFVPYVSSYMSKVFNSYNGTDSDASTETDLINPFDTDLTIDRIVGRVATYDNTLGIYYEVETSDVGSRYLTARMVDSLGNQIVKDFGAFNSVFNYVTHTWEIGQKLPPKAYYSVYLQKTAAGVSNATYRSQAMVSMVGYREVNP